jgi:pyruvate/2-oxoglutarate dehydrogenase complex dihydrolipoamide dehydrogenase (E3) component
VAIGVMKRTGVDVCRGFGRIVDIKQVGVEPWGGEEIEFEAKHAVVVITGSEPVIPDIPGFQRQNLDA